MWRRKASPILGPHKPEVRKAGTGERERALLIPSRSKRALLITSKRVPLIPSRRALLIPSKRALVIPLLIGGDNGDLYVFDEFLLANALVINALISYICDLQTRMLPL